MLMELNGITPEREMSKNVSILLSINSYSDSS